mgnify:CR=1 FL=1
MAIVYQKDKRSGNTYAYEASYQWDKEKKQSRSKRTLIGRVDPDTGEIVPTDGRGKKRSPLYEGPAAQECENTNAADELEKLRAENAVLKEQLSALLSELQKLRRKGQE